MEIDCLSCSSGILILDEEEKVACENCGVEVPPEKYQEMLAIEASNDGSKERLSQTSHKKHLVKVNLLINNVKDELQLNDSICEEIKYLYEKAFRKGYPRRLGHGRTKRHFYLTECVGACVYLALSLEVRNMWTSMTERRGVSQRSKFKPN